ncbi:MAG: hypothetical protein FH760_25585 [Geosporobacter ferrireducens]|nr:hypothetical protein [Geosporobacter ferrireducens]
MLINYKKIIYATYSADDKKKGLWNVYAAKIVGNALENKMQISQDIEYPGMPMAFWSSDSKSVLMYEPKIFKQDGRVFVEKAVIRKIKFK